MMERIDLTLAAARKYQGRHSLHVGGISPNEMVKEFDLVTLSSEFRHMLASARTMLAATKRHRADPWENSDGNERKVQPAAEDIGNVISLEHVNVCIPDQRLARCSISAIRD